MPDLDSALATIARFSERPPIARPPESDVARRASDLRRRRRVRTVAAVVVVVAGLAGAAIGVQSAQNDAAPDVISDTPTTVPVDPRTYLDAVIDTIEAEAYYADPADIARWREESVAVVEAAQTSDDTADFVHQILTELGDPTDPGPYLLPPPGTPRSTDARPSGEVVDGIGYLDLPANPAAPATEAGADYVRHARDLLEAPACGWIVDLRGDDDLLSGSNLTTLISAAGPLLGPGPSVGFRDRRGVTETYDVDESGAVTIGGDEVAPAVGGELPTSVPPVAVLQGVNTMGGYEGAVMAFRGGLDVRSFGLPTSGRLSATQPFRLPDGTSLVLTTGVVDRGGVVHATPPGEGRGRPGHDGSIPPDETVAPAGTRTDPEREAATEWLAGQPACR